MKQNQNLWEICENIYTELYKKAEPSADFNKLKKTKLNPEHNPSDQKPFLDYYLDQDKQDQTIEKHLKQHNLNKLEKRKIRTEIHLGAAPAGSKKAWRKN